MIAHPEPPPKATRAIKRVIILPWPPAALSPNTRTHWRARVKAMETCKKLASVAVRNAGWIAPAGDRIHLWVNFYPPTKRRPDDDNSESRLYNIGAVKTYRTRSMKTLKLEIELTYDDMLIHGDDEEERVCFFNDVLMNPQDLVLFSNEIGDVVGDVKVVRIIDGHEAFSQLKSESIDDD